MTDSEIKDFIRAEITAAVNAALRNTVFALVNETVDLKVQPHFALMRSICAQNDLICTQARRLADQVEADLDEVRAARMGENPYLKTELN